VLLAYAPSNKISLTYHNFFDIFYLGVFMNANLILMLASMAAGPFHFKDCVVVTKGFYEGCQGTVEEELSGDPAKYVVTLNCKKVYLDSIFKSDELKKCDK
jgi:hypothetical protein